MTGQHYLIKFLDDVSMDEVRDTLQLARLAAKAIYAEGDLLLDAVCDLDVAGRTCRIDARSAAGRDLLRLFINFVNSEYGTGAFTVERASQQRHDQPGRRAVGP